jgi:hypothetical protein
VTPEYRKIKRPFPSTARAHPVAHPAPPEATSQPFSRPRGRPPPALRGALRRRRRVASLGHAAKTGANVWDWLVLWGFSGTRAAAGRSGETLTPDGQDSTSPLPPLRVVRVAAAMGLLASPWPCSPSTVAKCRLKFLLCCRCCQAPFPIFFLPALLFFKGCATKHYLACPHAFSCSGAQG